MLKNFLEQSEAATSQFRQQIAQQQADFAKTLKIETQRFEEMMSAQKKSFESQLQQLGTQQDAIQKTIKKNKSQRKGIENGDE